MSHINNGDCPKCKEIFDKYPGFAMSLRSWFVMMQAKFQDLHISCAGRGHLEQEECFAKGASRARWGHSSHNLNAAIDMFFLVDGKYNVERHRYDMIASEIPDYVEWYGRPGASFPELPHYELKNWRELSAQGILKPVE
jgi:hypothetical protein